MSGTLKGSTTVLVSVSAVSYASALWWSAAFCWCVFIFLIPLFYAALRSPQQITAVHGLWWGLLFYLLHGYGIVQLFYEKACGDWRVVIALGILVYCALYAGVWFFVARSCTRLYATMWWRAVVWTSTTILYFIWMEQYAWFPVGTCMGYCFANPLLPLAEYKEFLATLPYITATGLLICLVAGAMAAAYALVHAAVRALVLAGICWLPFMYGWCTEYAVDIPRYLQHMHYVAPSRTSKHPLDCAEDITHALLTCMQQHPDAEYILMPESSFPWAINDCPEAVRMWCENALSDVAILILGTHRNAGDYHLNSLCCVNGGRVSRYYDKTLLMPLTEYLPKGYKECAPLKELFLRNNKEFTTSTTRRLSPTPLEIAPTFCCIPRMCAELYFDTAFAPTHHYPVLCLVNDAWFTAPYLRHLMYLFARYKALAWGREVIYISHYRGTWIAPHGAVLDLV